MNVVFFGIQIVLALLLAYSSFAVVFVSLFKKQFQPLSLFFATTVCIMAFFALRSIYKNWIDLKNLPPLSSNPFTKLGDLKRKRRLISGLLALCLISCLIGFFNIFSQYQRGVENSEMGQFSMSLSENVMESSYRQQQPPLDYYFSAFSHSLWGESKLAIRFHAMAFYLILCLILPMGLWFFCSSLWITGVGSSLFLLNHVIRLHSVHGRPLCLALLTGFLFLFFYLSFLNRNRAGPKNFFPVLASQYLFVMSIGLQPVIFICSLFLSSFWLLLNGKKDIFKKLLFSHVMIAGLTLPFYFNMWSFGRSAYKFKEVSWESIQAYFSDLNIGYFFNKYVNTFYEQMFPLFVVLTIGAVVAVLIKKTVERQFMVITLALLLFPLLYDSIFRTGLIWIDLNRWYIITFSWFLIIFAVLSLKQINSLFKNRTAKIAVAAFLLCLFSINATLQIKVIKNETQFYFPYRDNSMERVYDYLQERGSPEDLILEFSLVPIVVFRPEDLSFRKGLFHDPTLHPVFQTYHIEYASSPPFFYESGHDKIYYINWGEIPKGLQKIFFITFQDYEIEDKAYYVLSKFMQGREIGRIAVFEYIFFSEDKENEYRQLLHKIMSKTPKKQQGALYETLLYYAYEYKNQLEFKRLLQEYGALELFLDEFIPNFDYPSRFELRRRVKYFENMDWSDHDSDRNP